MLLFRNRRAWALARRVLCAFPMVHLFRAPIIAFLTLALVSIATRALGADFPRSHAPCPGDGALAVEDRMVIYSKSETVFNSACASGYRGKDYDLRCRWQN